MPSSGNLKNAVQVAIEVNHSELKWMIKTYYKVKRALFVWGSIGIGKSDVVREAAKEIATELELGFSDSVSDVNDETKFLVIDIKLSQMDPSDLRGIPVWDKNQGATVWLAPSTFPRKGRGIIFFDELNLSPPLVQASAYEMILQRRLGEYIVPEGFGLLAAGNRLEDRANVFDMAAPLKNRFGHVQLMEPSVDDWTIWASKHSIDLRIVGYLQQRRASLFDFDPKIKEAAFATPRSWEFCSDLIKGVKDDDVETLRLVVGSVIGVGKAAEFLGFLKLKNKLHPIKEYFNKPDTIDLPDNDVALMWALTTSILEYFQVNNKLDTIKSLVKLLKRFPEEYATFCLKLIYAIDNTIQSKLEKIPDATDLAQKLWKFLL